MKNKSLNFILALVIVFIAPFLLVACNQGNEYQVDLLFTNGSETLSTLTKAENTISQSENFYQLKEGENILFYIESNEDILKKVKEDTTLNITIYTLDYEIETISADETELEYNTQEDEYTIYSFSHKITQDTQFSVSFIEKVEFYDLTLAFVSDGTPLTPTKTENTISEAENFYKLNDNLYFESNVDVLSEIEENTLVEVTIYADKTELDSVKLNNQDQTYTTNTTSLHTVYAFSFNLTADSTLQASFHKVVNKYSTTLLFNDNSLDLQYVDQTQYTYNAFEDEVQKFTIQSNADLQEAEENTEVTLTISSDEYIINRILINSIPKQITPDQSVTITYTLNANTTILVYYDTPIQTKNLSFELKMDETLSCTLAKDGNNYILKSGDDTYGEVESDVDLENIIEGTLHLTIRMGFGAELYGIDVNGEPISDYDTADDDYFVITLTLDITTDTLITLEGIFFPF